MEDPSNGSSEIVLKQRIQIFYYYRKPNVQERRWRIFSEIAGKTGNSSSRT
jgi:hypothetical protein